MKKLITICALVTMILVVSSVAQAATVSLSGTLSFWATGPIRSANEKRLTCDGKRGSIVKELRSMAPRSRWSGL